MRVDGQTDRQTYTKIAILITPHMGEERYWTVNTIFLNIDMEFCFQ